ncbi:MAG TPA: hypothetical protein VE819_10910, partial [Steroidobacteraceae bacterium]|nr:hypothetical protein [Steroidobacteraceae bacterium]
GARTLAVLAARARAAITWPAGAGRGVTGGGAAACAAGEAAAREMAGARSADPLGGTRACIAGLS